MTTAEAVGLMNFLIALVCGPGALAAALFAVGRWIKVFSFTTISLEAADRATVGYLRLLDDTGDALYAGYPFLIVLRLALFASLCCLFYSLFNEWSRSRLKGSRETERKLSRVERKQDRNLDQQREILKRLDEMDRKDGGADGD